MVFNTHLEKDARFIKVLNDKMTNALALLDKITETGCTSNNIGPKPVTMEMFNLDIDTNINII